MSMLDAVVVGSGPNGLAAAVTLARAGLAVRVYERAAQAGGGSRTQELTLPGFRHDGCSAVHPLALASPFFRAFGLAQRIELLTPEVSFAHPLPGRAGIAYRDLERTAAELGRDGAAYRRLIGPLAARSLEVAQFTGSNLIGVPRHPLTAVLFGLRALAQGSPAWNAGFADEVAPAMITGVSAHAIVRQPSVVGAGAGLALQAHAHAGGWPIPRGGSQTIIDALIADLVAHGGEVVTDHEVTSLQELPRARATLLDVTPRALLHLAQGSLPSRYRRALRSFRYGNAAAKVDFALSGPVPWADPRVGLAGTVHLGGTRADIARAENDVAQGRHAAEPYVLVSQPSVLDDTRAPAGAQTLWTYTHVPAGSTVDQREAIIRTIERSAPGFRDLILDSRSVTAAQLPEENPNYIDGDISAGAATLPQLLRRPVLSTDPWRTPMPGVYLCGASTVPGPGVHGLSGWYAARSALRHTFRLPDAPSLAPSRDARRRGSDLDAE
ncbi:NAD(P)/FAD-dependent oxidoreductase [Microbacterium sp. zg.Y1090]|uniref:phytoene desaturase family protein n=1 Tax=Microbacterium TaxID=33882 RepID=UPI00214C8424|nr:MULTISPECIES: NAD(P)/FAD-dependent oxidoreductase [unclassified Microbacterium]MCR2813065.1 NAD(P)/FAD-dependent oxidoreductase [Microbacterium sp. zg.Y1084]MCR2819379.1 NAD(P)/FAD-dependent oxidoreductase [Microbacterium sp. zg.Y1090]MDL5487296.1 NAD(P)/FAD-dependent oxidoreductase [Microbacterium sp. zg-Y1211]WIM28359.1 NAD(P)/FAD-dependent oxidoreductase [Microbacterium sp. zg-Y1090]